MNGSGMIALLGVEIVHPNAMDGFLSMLGRQLPTGGVHWSFDQVILQNINKWGRKRPQRDAKWSPCDPQILNISPETLVGRMFEVVFKDYPQKTSCLKLGTNDIAMMTTLFSDASEY